MLLIKNNLNGTQATFVLCLHIFCYFKGSALDKPSKERGGATSLAVAQTSPTVKPEVVKVLVNKLTTKKKPQADVSLSSNTRDQY